MSVVFKKIDGSGKQILQQALKEIKNTGVAVGWLKEKKYPGSDMSVASVAEIQEFGKTITTKNATIVIPPRPFIRPAIEENKDRYASIVKEKLEELLEGKINTIEPMITAVGSYVAGTIAEKISQVTEPPLKDSTVRARFRKLSKSSRGKKPSDTLKKPLVDTGVLLNSITYYGFKSNDSGN